MHIPQYWAQARLRHETSPRHGATVQRWGWSDNSQLDAEAHAQQRAQQALDDVLKPKAPPNLETGVERMEWGREYGLDGATPIREEVLERRGDSVLTRNSYGAHCLNVERIAIADMDHPLPKRGPMFPVMSLIMLIIAVPWLWITPLVWSMGLAVIMVVIAAIGLHFYTRLRKWLHWREEKQSLKNAPPATEAALARVKEISEQHPNWGLRVYQTPKGLRVIVTHAPWSIQNPEVNTLFDGLNVDPLYALLCEKQQCFRARVTGKPWRMGMSGLSSMERRWPLMAPQHLQQRREWSVAYDKNAEQFAACHLLEQLGSTQFCAEAQAFVQWHDRACNAQTTLPLA